MTAEVVTLATFVSPVEANLAKNRLEAEGIRGFLENEEIVAMAWHLSNAVGEIKLLIAERDIEAALAALAEPPPDEEATLAAAIASSPEDSEAEAQAQEISAENDGTQPGQSDREADAYRAWRGAVFGLLFWPLQLYVTWLLIKVATSEEPLAAEYRRYAWAGAAINLPMIVGFCVLWRITQSA